MLTRQLEPVAAVGYPPREEEDWDRREESPPERQQEIREKSEQDEDQPKDLFLHELW
jgi:hypothetical protein